MVTLLTLFCALATALAQPGAESWKPDIVLPAPNYPFTFVGYGDIRFTDPADTKHSDVAMRRAEIARIVQQKPAFVVISGDLVLTGASVQDWKVFDAETAPLRQTGIEVLPALGNTTLPVEKPRRSKTTSITFPNSRAGAGIRYAPPTC